MKTYVIFDEKERPIFEVQADEMGEALRKATAQDKRTVCARLKRYDIDYYVAVPTLDIAYEVYEAIGFEFPDSESIEFDWEIYGGDTYFFFNTVAKEIYFGRKEDAREDDIEVDIEELKEIVHGKNV